MGKKKSFTQKSSSTLPAPNKTPNPHDQPLFSPREMGERNKKKNDRVRAGSAVAERAPPSGNPTLPPARGMTRMCRDGTRDVGACDCTCRPASFYGARPSTLKCFPGYYHEKSSPQRCERPHRELALRDSATVFSMKPRESDPHALSRPCVRRAWTARHPNIPRSCAHDKRYTDAGAMSARRRLPLSTERERKAVTRTS